MGILVLSVEESQQELSAFYTLADLLHPGGIFMHDNVPIHTAGIVEFLC